MPRHTVVRVARRGSIFTDAQAQALERISLNDESNTDLATQALDAMGIYLDDCCDGTEECAECRTQREDRKEAADDDKRAGV